MRAWAYAAEDVPCVLGKLKMNKLQLLLDHLHGEGDRGDGHA